MLRALDHYVNAIVSLASGSPQLEISLFPPLIHIYVLGPYEDWKQDEGRVVIFLLRISIRI